MSRLEELIEELCPNGVEYRKLGDICDILRGKRLTKSQLIEDGKYPVLHGGASPMGYYNEYNRKANTTVVVNTGNAGSVFFYDKKFWSSDACFSLYPHSCLLDRYLYHFASMCEPILKSKIRAGAMPTIDSTAVESLQIPVPPLEVQREIVRILDTFTEYTEELTEELTARKQQYEYYRDRLLKPVNIKENSEEIITLGNIGKVSMCKRIMKAETSSQGDIPFYKIGTFGGIADAFISTETFEKYRNAYSYPQKGDVLISASGTIGREVIFNGEPAYFQDSNIVWIANDESRVLNKYLYYYYQLQPWKASTGGTIARLYNDNISKTKIYAPSIERQKQIVDILDKFDVMCNDLTVGLPSEIEARQKQYEYYRDKLLTFKEQTG